MLLLVEDIPHTPIVCRKISISTFPEDRMHFTFRFRNRDQLRRLKMCLMIPDVVELSNRRIITGDEFLLMGLYRLVFPCRLSQMEDFFGIDYSVCARAVRLFFKFISERWGFLVTNNMFFWLPYLTLFRDKISEKLLSRFAFETNADFRVFGFIDNTVNATCRLYGGPVDDGEHARRFSPLIQQAFYTGWKKLHGLKWQTIDLPNGLVFHAWGGVSVRHSDNWTLFYSEIIPQLEILQANQPVQCVLYGDSAYSNGEYIKSRHKVPRGEQLPPHFIDENKAMSGVRQTIELNYWDLKNFWAMLNYKHLLKIRAMKVNYMFLTALILKNAHTCLNGSQTSAFFSCMPPTLEQYFQVPLHN